MSEIMNANRPFDSLLRVDARGEYWSARELQPLLGYVEWRKFENAIERAKVTCQNSNVPVTSNFVASAKVNHLGQETADYRLTRYACYLVAMNGDPRKPEIAAAQTYFAVRTREAEAAQSPRNEIDVLRAALDQIEAARNDAAKALETASDTSARLDAIEGRHDWYAALGYAKLQGWPTDRTWLQRLGTHAGRIGRAAELPESKVQHGLYGTVNQWPAWCWDEAYQYIGR